MVSAHIWLKSYSATSGGLSPTRQVHYLQREGAFAPVPYLERTSPRTKDYDDYVTGGTQHLPAWATGDAGRFFVAAKRYEGVNRYYAFQVEFSLPRELTHDQQMALRTDFMGAVMPDLPALWVKHEKRLANGDLHPHIHILFSARKQDEIARDTAQTFKRWERGHPERGGCEKDLFWSKPYAAEQLRAAFADVTNYHLEQADVDPRLDHRSLQRRELQREAIGRGGAPLDPETVASEQAQAASAWEQRKVSKGIEDMTQIPREEFVLLVRQWTRERVPGTAVPASTPEQVAAYWTREAERVDGELHAVTREVSTTSAMLTLTHHRVGTALAREQQGSEGGRTIEEQMALAREAASQHDRESEVDGQTPSSGFDGGRLEDETAIGGLRLRLRERGKGGIER